MARGPENKARGQKNKVARGQKNKAARGQKNKVARGQKNKEGSKKQGQGSKKQGAHKKIPPFEDLFRSKGGFAISMFVGR